MPQRNQTQPGRLLKYAGRNCALFFCSPGAKKHLILHGVDSPVLLRQPVCPRFHFIFQRHPLPALALLISLAATASALELNNAVIVTAPDLPATEMKAVTML